MLLQQKGAISIKNHRFLWNQSKNRTFLNKHKGAISKIAPIRPLKCGRRYLDIFNSDFLLLICLKSFENEIAPLKAHQQNVNSSILRKIRWFLRKRGIYTFLGCAFKGAISFSKLFKQMSNKKALLNMSK